MNTQANVSQMRMINGGQLIENTAVAMSELEKLIHSLEETLISTSQDARLNHSTALLTQDIDLISQTVSELRALLGRISLKTPDNLHFVINDIVEPIKLERLRELLLSEGTTPEGLRLKNPDAVLLFE